MNQALKTMVAFDIETTGLDPSRHRITCACLHSHGLSKTFLFKGEVEADDIKLQDEFLAHLDAAPRLCAFNGVRFDIPFICKAWNIPAERAGGWVRKTLDVFEASKLALGKTFSLDRLLEANGLEGKSGSGLQAIEYAREGKWDQLGPYCMQDTRMTYLATSQHFTALPVHTGHRAVVLQTLHPRPFVLW